MLDLIGFRSYNNNNNNDQPAYHMQNSELILYAHGVELIEYLGLNSQFYSYYYIFIILYFKLF